MAAHSSVSIHFAVDTVSAMSPIIDQIQGLVIQYDKSWQQVHSYLISHEYCPSCDVFTIKSSLCRDGALYHGLSLNQLVHYQWTSVVLAFILTFNKMSVVPLL